MSDSEKDDEGTADEQGQDREAPAPTKTAARSASGGGRFVAVIGVGLAIALGVVLFLRFGKSDVRRAAGQTGNVAEALESRGRALGAKRVREACASSATCACRQVTAHAALDADLHAEATASLASDPACAKEPKSQGMEAEALSRAGKHDEALAKANGVLKASPEEPFATYALAHASWGKGDALTAVQEATNAIRRGRGAPAHLLMALIHFRAKGYDAARVELEQMRKLDPNDVDALYNLALLAQIQNRYREAREGYLKVLQVAPKHADSRYNLGVLTHSVGALDETRHNLEQLKAIVAADDERVKKLEALLAGPPPNPGGGMVMAPGSAVPVAAPSGAPESNTPLPKRP